MPVADLRNIFQEKAGGGFTAAMKRGAVALALAAAALFSPAGNADAAENGLRVQESHTQHSRDIDDMRRTFNPNANTVIVPIDSDWFQLNAALNGSTVLDRPFMTKLIDIYVREKSGLVLPVIHLNALRDMMALGVNNTYSLHLQDKGTTGALRKVCFLFSAGVDQNKAAQVKEYLLGIRPQIHSGIAALPLATGIHPHLQDKYNRDHEIGHCFDQTYVEESLTRREKGEGISPAANVIHAHKGETFSEVFGALKMAHDGTATDIIAERRALRLAGNAMIGPMAYRLQSDMPLPGGRNAGFVYMFDKALEATQKKIDELGDSIQTMTLDDLAVLARDITETSALGENEALGAMFLWQNLFDVDKLDEAAPMRLETRRVSLDFRQAYDFAIEFRQKMNEALPHVLNFGTRKVDDALGQIGFDFTSDSRLKPGFGAEDIKPVYMIRDELLEKPGVRKDASLEALIHAYEDYKDEARGRLEAGTEKERREARYVLSVVPEALRLAIREMTRPVRTAAPVPQLGIAP
jgi:hypothetical protein